MQIHQSYFQIEPTSFGESISELTSKLDQILEAWINEGHQDGKTRKANFDLLNGCIFRKPIYFDLDGVATISKIDQVIVWQQDLKLHVAVTSDSVERISLRRYADLGAEHLLSNSPSVLATLFANFKCRMGLDLTNEPFEFVQSRDDIDKLSSALRSNSRTSLMVLTSTTEHNLSASTQSHIWNIVGSGAYIRVIPEVWFNEVNEELGISHSLTANGFRVFLPNVNFDVSQDGYRHPVFTANPVDLSYSDSQRIGQMRDRLTKANWRNADSNLLSHLRLEGHKALRHADLVVSKNETKNALQGAESDWKQNLESRIKSLEAELEDFVNLAGELESQAATNKFEAEFANLQLEEQAKELASARESGAYFRRVLEENQLFGQIYEHEPNQFWGEVPESFEELVFSIATVPFVEFTGSLDPVKELDSQPSNKSGLVRCWESLRALSDYARLKAEGKFEGSFYNYLQGAHHSGYLVSAGYFAHNESESVQNDPDLKNKRLFPVPANDFSDGSAYMFAHAKLITGSSNSPRMHYLDDTSGTGRIFVGYIGAHLPTPATN